MEIILKIVMSAILSLLTILGSIVTNPPEIGTDTEPDIEIEAPSPDISTINFSYLQYPEEAVKTLTENDTSLKKYKNRATDGDGLYEEAQGYTDVNGVVISPYYRLRINDFHIPVYSTVVFVGDTETCELHSFAEIYIDKDTTLPLNIKLISEELKIRDATWDNDRVSSLAIITIIVSRNSVKLHCFDTKYTIWYRIFFENSTVILSMTVMQNCICEKQFCKKPIESAFAKRNCVSTDYNHYS